MCINSDYKSYGILRHILHSFSKLIFLFCTNHTALRINKASGVTVDGRPVREEKFRSQSSPTKAPGDYFSRNSYEHVDDLPIQSSLNLNSEPYKPQSSPVKVMHEFVVLLLS